MSGLHTVQAMHPKGDATDVWLGGRTCTNAHMHVPGMQQRASSGYVSCAAGEVPLSWGRVEKKLAAGPPWCARQLDQQVHGSSGAQPPRSGPLANHRHHRSTGVEGSEGGDLREGQVAGGRGGQAGLYCISPRI